MLPHRFGGRSISRTVTCADFVACRLEPPSRLCGLSTSAAGQPHARGRDSDRAGAPDVTGAIDFEDKQLPFPEELDSGRFPRSLATVPRRLLKMASVTRSSTFGAAPIRTREYSTKYRSALWRLRTPGAVRDLAVALGVNLQPGQDLAITGSSSMPPMARALTRRHGKPEHATSSRLSRQHIKRN